MTPTESGPLMHPDTPLEFDAEKLNQAAEAAQTLNADPEQLERFKEMHDHALREIEESQNDPTQQQYFKRMDKKTIIKSEGEFAFCMSNGVGISIVDFESAVECDKQEEARDRAKHARRKAQKRARRSRKANRK